MLLSYSLKKKIVCMDQGFYNLEQPLVYLRNKSKKTKNKLNTYLFHYKFKLHDNK